LWGSFNFTRWFSPVFLWSCQWGMMYYFGVRSGLRQRISSGLRKFNFPIFAKCHKPDLITITISSDGLPLSRSSNVQFWPLLCRVDQAKDQRPFLVSLYCGNSKPNNCNDYILDFVKEMSQIESEGIEFNYISIP